MLEVAISEALTLADMPVGHAAILYSNQGTQRIIRLTGPVSDLPNSPCLVLGDDAMHLHWEIGNTLPAVDLGSDWHIDYNKLSLDRDVPAVGENPVPVLTFSGGQVHLRVADQAARERVWINPLTCEIIFPAPAVVGTAVSTTQFVIRRQNAETDAPSLWQSGEAPVGL